MSAHHLVANWAGKKVVHWARRLVAWMADLRAGKTAVMLARHLAVKWAASTVVLLEFARAEM